MVPLEENHGDQRRDRRSLSIDRSPEQHVQKFDTHLSAVHDDDQGRKVDCGTRRTGGKGELLGGILHLIRARETNPMGSGLVDCGSSALFRFEHTGQCPTSVNCHLRSPTIDV